MANAITKGRAKARRAKLTKRIVETLEPPNERFIIVWDTKETGFGVRVMACGIRTYILDYRDKLRGQHRIKIARHGVLTCEQARERARGIKVNIALGKDPIAELEAEREAARNATTFKALAEKYIAKRCEGKIKKPSGPEDTRIIRRELLPRWGRKLARDVSRRDVIALTDQINDREAPVMANRTLSLIHRLYNFGIDKALIERNPAAHVKRPADEQSRNRVLKDSEIEAFWHGLDKLPGDPRTRAALRLVLVTAQRPGEVVDLQWNEIDDKNVWMIPAEKSKNGRAQRVPLSPLAVELLHSLEHAEKGPVFPSPLDPGESIKRSALAHLLNRGRAILAMEHFTPHDLRRTAASTMASIGIDRLVIEKILNHSESGVTGRTYELYEYDIEKRRALLKWGRHLEGIISGETRKVVSIARRRSSRS